MAKSLPLVAQRNFILRIKVHCSKCENKTKLFLLSIPGLHSATIDRKEGTVRISGTVKPSRIITLLEHGVGLKAELLWDQSSSTDLQIVSSRSRKDEDKYNDPHQTLIDPNQIMSQLRQLSGIQGLESVEIKLNFARSKDNGDVKVVVHGGSGGSDVSNAGFRRHHDHDRDHDHARGYPVTSSFNGFPNLQRPPPWSGGYNPSAPPYDDAPPPPPPPPVRDASFFNQFSDDNTSSCVIM